ncbi:unnamed protein product [Chilo suppressalis]|uniref:Cyclic nucleotide-binding domain-containing protein n=1 Tax=Chilo suppressalis TaxID=168631 RepID=A0ABN8L0Y5_CHISP|nr:unnamed protein product [Chilo suppressalis]
MSVMTHMTHKTMRTPQNLRGRFFWESRMKKITLPIMLTPWNMCFQSIVLLSVIYNFVVQLLLGYYLSGKQLGLEISVMVTELFFVCDVLVHLLHFFWPLVRLNLRVYRRNSFFLLYDVISIIPLTLIFKLKGYTQMVLVGRWFVICRIYRLFSFFKQINENVRHFRMQIYIAEHMLCTVLFMHASTCLWYGLHKDKALLQPWYNIGYPPHVNSRNITFDTYLSCFYYSACRIFNVIFGDLFPMRSAEKLLTAFIMFIGYIFTRYVFIGYLAWELALKNRRRSTFVDRYHHMIRYLKFHKAPAWLIEQAAKYKLQLWEMKDGVLTSNELKKLPLPLQMELIFDINVGDFHNTLLFKNADESFLRQISLLMRHEIFLAGQHVWSQGVVKNGMICVKRGVIEMLSDEDDESPMIAFKTGTVLGELALFYSIPAKVTVKAATYIELQVLRRTDFMRVIAEHPVMLQHIREKIYNRLHSTRKRQEAITQYDKGDSRLIRTRYRPMKVLKDNLAEVEEEDPTFVDDSHMYYKDENNVRQPKFTSEYLELYQLSNNVTTIEAPRICLRASFPWILEPNTTFTHMFEIGHFATVIYLCIMSPHYAIQNEQSEIEIIFTTVVTAGMLLNIYIQLTTAIVDKNVKKVTVKEIAEVKMATLGFYLDILSLFPAHIFTDTLDPNGESMSAQIVKLFPILQVWHIWDYFNKWMKNFDCNIKLLTLIKYCILLIIFCYWSGCFLYLFACPRKLCFENSWMARLIYWETKMFMTTDAKHDKPLASSFTFGTSTFTGSGTSDIAPGSDDLLIVLLIFILGSYLSYIYTAQICSLYLQEMQRKLKFKESMRELFYFLTVNHVSEKIKARVKKFFCVQWYYNKDVSTREIFEDMSSNIQQEVLSIEMVETLLFCPIFQDCSRDFLQTVAANSRTIVLPDNEIVQHGGDIGRDMYIVQKGHCNLLDHQGKVIHTIRPGNNFGVMEMLFGLPKVYTVLTTTNCILLHVEYSTLVQCWGTFPDISHPIMTVLEDTELRRQLKQYEEAKPLTGRMDTKINRIAQEIKESFVVLSGWNRVQYVNTFDRLGVMKYLRYVFLPGSITPHGMFLKFWCALRFVLAVYYILTIPYNFATRQYKYSFMYTWPDILLYIDVVVMAYVAYYNEKSLLVTHPLLTTSRYLKSTFILDIISIFPLEQVLRIVNENTNMDLYRMNRMLLVTRIMGAFNYWESDILNVNPIVVLIKFLPIAVTVVNFATAIIFTQSCTPFLERRNNTVMARCMRVLVISASKFDDKYAAAEYTNTFFWVFEIFIGCGCTPAALSNNVMLRTCLTVTGYLYFAFVFGYVASSRSTQAHALLEHSKICRGLNTALMEDTLVFMYEKALREVPIFGRVERSFIRVFTQHVREMYFLKGDIVIQCHDVQPYIYIIYRGKVDVLSSYNEMITCMGPGGMFGNFSGQPIACSSVAIYSSRSLDLLVISSQTFFNLIKYYPKIQEPLNKALQISKDYIMPITMNVTNDSSSEESEVDAVSLESGLDSRSESSRSFGQVVATSSISDVSQTARSGASVLTNYSYTSITNLLRPGSWLFQGFGYMTCLFVTMNYVVLLYELTTLNDCNIIFWLEAMFDIFFYFKLCLTIHQGYVTKHGELVIDAHKCRKRYVRHKTWLWTDILANLPLELFGFCFSNPLRAMHYLRANKLLRLKYLIDFCRKTAGELTNNLTTLQVVITVIVVVLLIHTFACVWLLTLTGIAPVSNIRTLKLHLIDDDASHRLWDYITSIYIVIAELTMTGSDEYVIDTVVCMSIMVVCLICGKMLATTVVATSIQVAYSTKYALTTYEMATAELIDMLKNQGLSSYQLKKFWKYVRQLWMTERGRQLPELLRQTPYVRRCDLMSAMFGHYLRNCYLFADMEQAFLRQLACALDYTVFFPGNYIVVAGDCDARMFWVASGIVSVVSVRPDLTETTHETLTVGNVFGILQGMNRGIAHCFSYRAESKVAILTLSLDSISNILPFFPSAQATILEKADVLFAQL